MRYDIPTFKKQNLDLVKKWFSMHSSSTERLSQPSQFIFPLVTAISIYILHSHEQYSQEKCNKFVVFIFATQFELYQNPLKYRAVCPKNFGPWTPGRFSYSHVPDKHISAEQFWQLQTLCCSSGSILANVEQHFRKSGPSNVTIKNTRFLSPCHLSPVQLCTLLLRCAERWNIKSSNKCQWHMTFANTS